MRALPARHANRFNLRYALAYAVLILAAIAFQGQRQPAVSHGVQVEEVVPAAAMQLIESGAIIVDVRSVDAFSYRRIPGAMLLTIADLNAGLIPTQLAAMKDRAVVVYCGEGVAHGPQGTQLLNQAGFTRAVNLKGGIEAWEKAGYNVARG